MTKIVSLQPAKAGQILTVTDSQGRTFQAEAVGDIADGKGILFIIDGKYKVVGNSSQTQRERTILDRHTPKRKTVKTSYIKVLSYEETETEYKFYISGDRSPELIYSLPIQDTIIWGNISSQSQKKSDWTVGILYYDYDEPVILEAEYWVGELDYLADEPTPGLVKTGTYKLLILSPTSETTYSANDYGNILEYLQPSGNGVFGNYSIDDFLNDAGLDVTGVVADTIGKVLIDNELENWAYMPAGTPYRNYTVYSLEFTDKYSLWSNHCPLILSNSAVSAIENEETDMNSISLFSSYIDLINSASPRSYFVSYPFVQVDVGATTPVDFVEEFEVVSISEDLEGWLLNDTWDGQGDPLDRLWPLGSSYIDLGAVTATRADYKVVYAKEEVLYPNNYYSPLKTTGYKARLDNVITQFGLPYRPGQGLYMTQESSSLIFELNIYQLNSVTKNEVSITNNVISCTAITSRYASDYNSRVVTGDRYTAINRASIINQSANVLGTTSPVEYDAFRYSEKTSSGTVNGERLQYTIPALLFYQDNSNLIVKDNSKKIINTPSTNEEYPYNDGTFFYNGSNWSYVEIPDESDYFLSLKNGKFQGIDKAIANGTINLKQWAIAEELETPKTVKVKAKGINSSHTVLSADFSD